MATDSKILIYVIMLLLVDALPLPLPITASIILYVVLQRPAWFSSLYHRVYQ